MQLRSGYELPYYSTLVEKKKVTFPLTTTFDLFLEGFATVPNVSFSDIGALDNIRHELEMAIVAPVKYPELIVDLGLDVPSGVLLCGPPGCGKTLLAKAVANQAGINFISVTLILEYSMNSRCTT